jgi:hypothetical protein
MEEAGSGQRRYGVASRLFCWQLRGFTIKQQAVRWWCGCCCALARCEAASSEAAAALPQPAVRMLSGKTKLIYVA